MSDFRLTPVPIPYQGSSSSKFLTTNGTNMSWSAVSAAGLTYTLQAKTTTYTATTSDDYISVDGSSAAWTLTLPAASNTGKILRIKRIDNTPANAITLSGTIDGVANPKMFTQYESYTIMADGTEWKALERFAKTPWSSTSTITIASTGTSMAKGTNTVDRIAWRRDGNTMHIFAAYKQTAAGTAGTGVYLITLPASQSADTTAMIASTDTTAGAGTAVRANSALKGNGWAYSVNGTSRGVIVPVLWDSTRISMCFTYSSEELWTAAGVFKFNETDWGFGLHAEIPILNWQP